MQQPCSTRADNDSRSPLQALYYPFSRCIEANALKQLLLVFDGVTFLDPVEDGAWRARLFQELETSEDARFRKYRDLEGPLRELEQEGAIVLQRPRELPAFHGFHAVAGAVSDLADPVWCDIARRPEAFHLPHQRHGPAGAATWQIFADKIAPGLREQLHSTALDQHVIADGGDDYAWTLSYEAGSASTLNLHLAAANDLGLAPVTDSAMHHRLLIRKMVRASTPHSEWTEPDSPAVEATAHQVARELIGDLLPKSVLDRMDFEDIIRFRQETAADREALVRDLKTRLHDVAELTSWREIAARQQAVAADMEREVREYRAALASTRDRLWPGLVGASTAAAVGGSAGVSLQMLAGGPLGVIAGALAGTALSLLKSALDARADERKLDAGTRHSVAYLSRVAALH
jgi:hypothetical protein